jgi:glycosyltransferase involved in cell wall biosynthesis
MPRVAIGMPVWNGERFISEAIDSILAQTYDDFELVISDNASTDATAEICRAYAKRDTRIRYIRQEKNVGGHPNHNVVFHRSSSEYFRWAAADDVLAPELIQECVRVLDEDRDIVVCSPATVLINEDGSPVGYSPQHKDMVDNYGTVWPISLEKHAQVTSADPVDRFAAVLWDVHLCFEIYGLIRRSALERTSLLMPYYGADKVVLAELSLLGRYHLLEAPLFYRRCHPGQASVGQSRRDLVMWSSGRKSQILPREARMMAAYVRAALSAKLTPVQKSRCLSVIGRRALARGFGADERIRTSGIGGSLPSGAAASPKEGR